MPICTLRGIKCRKGSERSLSLRWGQHLVGKCIVPTHTNTHTHTQQRQGRPTHGLLIAGCGFLQPSTMGSSPDCCSRALFVSQPLFWRRMCGSFFLSLSQAEFFPSPWMHGRPPLPSWSTRHTREVSHVSAFHRVTSSQPTPSRLAPAFSLSQVNCAAARPVFGQRLHVCPSSPVYNHGSAQF